MPQILLIDDDVLVLKSVKRLLEQNGFTVETAKTGAEGVEKATANGFDLIICDVRMPGLDGLATISEIGEQDRAKNRKTPVIFITGYASEEAPIRAIKLGVSDYILKPFDIDQLLASVKNQLNLSQNAL